MCASGPRPDVVTFNTMIAACSHLGDAHAALKMFGAMADAGITPTEPTFGALLNTYAKARNVPSARLIFDSLQVGGLGQRTVADLSHLGGRVGRWALVCANATLRAAACTPPWPLGACACAWPACWVRRQAP